MALPTTGPGPSAFAVDVAGRQQLPPATQGVDERPMVAASASRQRIRESWCLIRLTRSVPRAGRYQAQLGRRIDWRRARLGDLVVYTRRNGTLRHAMLALGNGWVVGARGGDENVAANRPSAFIDLRRADYWSSALSHAVATGAAA